MTGAKISEDDGAKLESIELGYSEAPEESLAPSAAGAKRVEAAVKAYRAALTIAREEMIEEHQRKAIEQIAQEAALHAFRTGWTKGTGDETDLVKESAVRAIEELRAHGQAVAPSVAYIAATERAKAIQLQQDSTKLEYGRLVFVCTIGFALAYLLGPISPLGWPESWVLSGIILYSVGALFVALFKIIQK